MMGLVQKHSVSQKVRLLLIHVLLSCTHYNITHELRYIFTILTTIYNINSSLD